MSDYRTTSGEPLPEMREERVRRRRMWVRRTLGILVFVTAVGFVLPVHIRVATNGYVTSETYAEVRPAAAGRVADILVGNGDLVAAGVLLVQLDDAEEQALLDAARKAVDSMVARIDVRQAELAQEERLRAHRLQEAQLRYAHAERDLVLTQELHTKGLASERALAQSRVTQDLALLAIRTIEAEDAGLGSKVLTAMERELEELRSAVARAAWRLQARQVRAPIDGYVVRYAFVEGELVSPDYVLYEIFGAGPRILKLRVPERFATRVQPGDPYEARLRAVGRWSGNPVFRGKVLSMRGVIQVDNQNAYRMADCSFDAGAHQVPPGASTEARIIVARVPFWFWMFGLR
ncbi:MAG: HlyD family secretion protein [Kiritimatiellia bacterium]